MKRFKKPRNVTYKHINEWANYWLPLVWSERFDLFNLIANIIPNENEFHEELNFYLDNKAIEICNTNILEFITTNLWIDIAKWLFSICYHFQRDFKSYFSKLSMIDIKICYDSEDNEAIVFIDLVNTKYFIKEEVSRYDNFSNSFKCDKFTSLKIKEILANENLS